MLTNQSLFKHQIKIVKLNSISSVLQKCIPGINIIDPSAQPISTGNHRPTRYWLLCQENFSRSEMLNLISRKDSYSCGGAMFALPSLYWLRRKDGEVHCKQWKCMFNGIQRKYCFPSKLKGRPSLFYVA